MKIIHVCLRLHNFINQRNLSTIYSEHVRPPPIADIDENGRLIDNRWREGALPPEDLMNLAVEAPANSLRERIRMNIVQDVILYEIIKHI